MFTKKLQPYICKFADFTYQKFHRFAKWLVKNNISADLITFLGICFAISALNFLAVESYLMALICLLFNRLCDILDGMTARLKHITKFGIFFDIFADYTSFGLFLWGFILANPEKNSISGSFLIVCLFISAVSLLSFAISSNQDFRKINQSGIKICLWGHIQNFDTFIALFLMCLFNQYFLLISVFFGLLLLGKSLIIISKAYYELEIKN